MDEARSRIRRMLPVLLVVLFAAWIVFIVVLIALHPHAGSGNPKD